MNHKTKAVLSLGLLIASVVLAASIFQFLQSRFTAALIAGGGFASVQILILWFYRKSEWRVEQWMFVVACINLGVFSIPQMALRLANPDRPTLMDMIILGVPFSWVHLTSQFFMLGQMLLMILIVWASFKFSTQKASEK